MLKGLSPELRTLITERAWSSLTDIQRRAIPEILEGKNVLLIAPTGHGKTEAAIIPILDMMLRTRARPVSVLYVTPLRALINDLTERIRWWASRLGFIVARKHGDVPQKERNKRHKHVPHIMVLTPESLEIDLDWAPRFRRYYENVRWVVIDEVHELASSKRGVQLSVLLERLRDLTGYDFQTVGLSATVGDPERVARLIFGSSERSSSVIVAPSCKDIRIAIDASDHDSSDPWEAVGRRIVEYIKGPTLVFVNSRFAAERLGEIVERLGLNGIYVHHSSVSRELRREAEKRLKDGSINAVVCTRTLELGIDVGSVKRVIQIRPTGSVSSLLQRVGRSGHNVGESSEGVLIALDGLEVLEAVATAVLAVKGDVEPSTIIEKPLDVLARQMVAMTMQYGAVDPERMYSVIRRAYPFRTLTPDEFRAVLDYLLSTELLTRSRDGKLRLGPSFHKLWRFDTKDKKWWAKNFAEFFSMIGERDSFAVKHENGTIGDVDALYVYKYLRVGDKIRLGGTVWKVIDIDESLFRVLVVPAEEGDGDIPLWRGEGARRSGHLAHKFLEILKVVIDDPKRLNEILPSNVTIAERAYRYIEDFRSRYLRVHPGKVPGPSKVIVERRGDEYYFILVASQNIIDALAHFFMYLVSKEVTLNVSMRSSFYGFMIRSPINPLHLLKGLTTDQIKQLLEESVMRSPIVHALAREMQVSFGKVGKVGRNDDIIWKEAFRQALFQYFDLEGAYELLESIINGDVEVVVFDDGELSPLAHQISKLPAVKPWFEDISKLIVENLEGMAFTVEELADVVGLPPRTVESKLKDLRKSEDENMRVYQFIDITFGEWRWALVKDAKSIRESDEFADSFTPRDESEVFMLMIKPKPGDSYLTFLFSPKDVLRDCRSFIERIPVGEAYEVKVLPLTDSLVKSLAPKYYHVPRTIMCDIALNGSAFLQKLKEYG